jgi:Bacterial archaeo-eukaryotic release factor family 3
VFPGNHDRTSWRDLHHLSWPLVADWLRTDRQRALASLEVAKSHRRYAGGLEEIWALANEGRVEQLVVEDSFAVAAEITQEGIVRVDDSTLPGVIDDLVDEVIEAVLARRGIARFVHDGDLIDSGRIAAVLRY